MCALLFVDISPVHTTFVVITLYAFPWRLPLCAPLEITPVHTTFVEITPVHTTFCGDYPFVHIFCEDYPWVHYFLFCEDYLLDALLLWRLPPCTLLCGDYPCVHYVYIMTHYNITMGNNIA